MLEEKELQITTAPSTRPPVLGPEAYLGNHHKISLPSTVYIYMQLTFTEFCCLKLPWRLYLDPSGDSVGDKEPFWTLTMSLTTLTITTLILMKL